MVLFLLGVFILKHGKPDKQNVGVYKNWCGIDEGLFVPAQPARCTLDTRDFPCQLGLDKFLKKKDMI